ncbi:hypothetical protein [Roseateles toxinivorans]|uniref:Uncharacterized protein n=1 Tax=Roseateles toxinivorans TaxID=270368 RepID=A0A4R6QN69_9BURK|nr:hypothetical protein [Roseateles toxinivorans]TDP64315.1 hypothetical protein DES47_104605 [Roseateles toxinivorans]
MLNRLLTRWLRPTAPPTRERADIGRWQASINPPSLYRGDSFFQTLLRWMPGETDAWDAIGHSRGIGAHDELPVMRARFIAQLDDIHRDDVEALLARIKRSRSLRDLWHLRPAVYNMVARAHDQGEAELRMHGINQMFPARPGAGRSGRRIRH